MAEPSLSSGGVALGFKVAIGVFLGVVFLSIVMGILRLAAVGAGIAVPSASLQIYDPVRLGGTNTTAEGSRIWPANMNPPGSGDCERTINGVRMKGRCWKTTN